MARKRIELPCYDIVVSTDGRGGGDIKSALLEGSDPLDEEDCLFVAGIESLESLILAHACAGVDISTPAYIEGIETAVDKLHNMFL